MHTYMMLALPIGRKRIMKMYFDFAIGVIARVIGVTATGAKNRD